MSTPAADRLVADRYALRAPLGRGGMGVVWRAQDAVLGREVAIKEVVFPPAMADEERRLAQARVMREARAAARLNHPAAVTLYDVVQDRGGTFIVMELVDAPTLADLVRADGPLPVERVAEIGAQVAGALEAAHAAGIVHRDVKPGNVMVPDGGTAKLADFGIASLQGDPQLTSTGLVIGSPAYMAPEQAKGEESGPPADFWALGATMFFAVEGEPPFDRGSSIATLAAVVNEPARRPGRAGALTPLITALLAKDPGSRPSGPELRAELGRLAATRPSPPTEVLPVHGPGRTVPMPAATPGAPPPATPGAPPPAGPVDTEEHPTPPSATLPLRGISDREVGVPPAGPSGAAAAAAVAAAGSAGSAAAGEAARSAARGEGAGSSKVDEADGSRPDRDGAGSRSGGDGAGVPPVGEGAGTPDLAEGAGALPGGGGRDPARPLLPPAPAVDRGGRGRMVGALAALVVLGLVAVLIVANLRSGDDGDPNAAPATTSAGDAGAGASETTRQGGSTTGASETTGEPTTTVAGGGLPEGWTAFTNERGSNRVGVPPGFRARTRESYNATVVEEQNDPGRVFTVRSTNPANPLPQASRAYREAAPGLFPEGYREVRYEENRTYAGHPGAVVFEYEAVRDGRRVHVSHVNLKGRTWGYNVEFIVPAEQWDASLDLARQFEQAFQPLG